LYDRNRDNCDVIAAKSPAQVTYRPFLEGGAEDLYLIFAQVGTSNKLLEFVEKYGLLDSAIDTPVPFYLEEAKFFKSLISHHESPKVVAEKFKSRGGKRGGGVQWVGSINIVANPSRGMRFTFAPHYLIDALWFQLTFKLSGNCSFADCRLCGHLFERGVAAGRRADAEFCTDEHRKRFNSLKRAKGKNAIP
jgi:hypothetical protein